MSMQWLQENAPGFNKLSDDERNAIVDFSLLWSLFEARILDNSGSASCICSVVDDWRDEKTLQAESYDPELAYFRQRYFANGDFTRHFEHLHLRDNDRPGLVRGAIAGDNNNPRDRVAALLIIILRFRNNLFHGMKWHYELAGQLDNFDHANAVLMKALDQHGRLAV